MVRHAGHAPRGADVEPRAVARKERSILGRRRVEPRARLRVEAGSDDRPSGAVVAAGAILERVLEGPLWISDYTPPVDLISEWSAWTIWQMKGGTFDRLRRRRRIFQKIAPLNEVQEDGAVGGLGSKEEKKEIRDREILRSEIGGARLGSVVRSPKIDLR